MLRRLLVVIFCSTSVANAQPVEVDVKVDIEPMIEAVIQRITSPEAEKIVRGTVRRARRAIALGPTVGGWAGYAPSPEVSEQAITFGIGVEIFKIPVLPSLTNFKAIMQERVKAKLRQTIVDRFKGVAPEPGELDRLAIEAFEEAKAEILGERETRGKTMERPRFSFALEANRMFDDAGTWMGRTRVGVGIWKLTLAGSFTVGRANDNTLIFVGPELAMHFLLSKAARSPVVDVFVRGDFEVKDRDVTSDFFTVGARFLLDVI